MRRLALIVIVGLITLWLSGCAASQPAPEPAQEAEAPAVTEEAAASEPAEAPTEAAASEEAAPTADAAAATSSEDSAEPITIVFSNIAETATLDPAIAFSSDGLEFVRNVYEGLLEYVPASTELRPALAESWGVSEDGLTYTFTLRQGVKYHDGADFNAEAAKMGLDRIKEINQGPASLMTDISSIEAVDAQTLKITLSRPNVFFLGVLPKLPLVSPQAIETNKTDADPWANDFFATNGVGTGPYKFDSWNKGSQIVMVKNTDYWQEWLPFTADRVILRVDADISTALQLLGQGQIDMLGAVGPDDSIAAKDLPGVKLVEQPQFQVSILTLNTNNKPLDDVKVREAIKYAFDYQAFADFFQGLGETPTGPLPKNAEGVDPSLPVQQQDLEKAKQLLAEAGYPDGGFKLRYLGLKGLSYEEFAGTLLQQNLAELGIELEQILVPWPQMPPTMADKATAPDISYLNQSMFTNDPTFILRTSYFSGNTADKSGYNWSYYVDAEVDKWLDEIPTIQDEQERTEALYNLQQKIVGDVPALYVVTPTLAQPVRENIEGAVYETLDYNYLVRFFYVQKMPQQ
ncbi:MAG: ABC transporter substrate-binding protein [Anaerolineae bacterium]|nr:ABC transporter substrate-binding protein [Anaerolineae bacterium]